MSINSEPKRELPEEEGWRKMMDIMEGFEISKGGKIGKHELIDRVANEVIKECSLFSFTKISEYIAAIDAIKKILDELMLLDKNKDKERIKYLLIQKAEFIGTLPSVFEIRQNVARLTVIDGLENVDFLKFK